MIRAASVLMRLKCLEKSEDAITALQDCAANSLAAESAKMQSASTAAIAANCLVDLSLMNL